jgi:predicted Fe-S protein YdhL (DUF1289 family)
MVATKIEAEKVLMVLGKGGNMPSPCISVCRMDEASGLCEGCLRTLEEIACWSTLGETGKREVWSSIGRRIASQEGSKP